MYVMRGHFPKQAMAYYMPRKMWWLAAGVRVGGQIVSPTVPYEDCYFLEDAKRFRAEITSVPLIYVGGVCSRESAEKVLRQRLRLFPNGACADCRGRFPSPYEGGGTKIIAQLHPLQLLRGTMYTID